MCIDTSVLTSLVFENEMTERVRELLKTHSHYDFYITTTILNELLYVIGRRITGKSPQSFRRYVAEMGYPEKALHTVSRLTSKLFITVVEEPADKEELITTIKNYRLLPSDAIISLACRRHNIPIILSFDTDFDRVPWLQRLPRD